MIAPPIKMKTRTHHECWEGRQNDGNLSDDWYNATKTTCQEKDKVEKHSPDFTVVFLYMECQLAELSVFSRVSWCMECEM